MRFATQLKKSCPAGRTWWRPKPDVHGLPLYIFRVAGIAELSVAAGLPTGMAFRRHDRTTHGGERSGDGAGGFGARSSGSSEEGLALQRCRQVCPGLWDFARRLLRVCTAGAWSDGAVLHSSGLRAVPDFLCALLFLGPFDLPGDCRAEELHTFCSRVADWRGPLWALRMDSSADIVLERNRGRRQIHARC